MIKPLTHWSLNRTLATIDDTESLSVLELVGKVSTKMNELINDYNKFVDEINKLVEEYKTGITTSQECFEKRMTKTIHDYLDYLDTKVKTQDKVVADAVEFMKTNLSESITTLINEMHDSGELDEAVLNAIDGIGSRVTSLETSMSTQQTKTNDIESRVISLEKQTIEIAYNEENEDLTILIGGEA